MSIDDTIAAVSTPFGRGAIAVIRVTGDRAVEIASKVFKPKSVTLTELDSSHAVYGVFYADGSAIDDGFCVVYRAPHSLTGQDVVELSCHGGILVTQCILQELFSHGARAAQAGEFTRRAFCAGKLDLPQAEAISIALEARSREALVIGTAQRCGSLSGKIKSLFSELSSLIASVYVYIDFPDESLSDIPPEEIRPRVESLLHEISSLLGSYRTGKAVAEGIKTAICGKPNSGKSSLLNMLLGEDRAIVTEIAGTTRDTIEETAVIGGVTLLLCDTAGIRDASDSVEKLGIARSIAAAESAELVIAVFDGASGLDDNDCKLFVLLKKLHDKGKKIIAAINKSDLPQLISPDVLESRFAADALVSVSSVTGSGFDDLRNAVRGFYIDGSLEYGSDAIITNARQFSALKAAERRLQSAINTIDSGMTADIVGFDLEEALGKLGELDGRSVSEEVVDNIFRSFCVGK